MEEGILNQTSPVRLCNANRTTRKLMSASVYPAASETSEMESDSLLKLGLSNDDGDKGYIHVNPLG